MDPIDVLELDIRADLDRVEDALKAAVEGAQPLVRDAAGHVLASGGKRFRPMLVLLGGRLGDHVTNESKLRDCAVAIELTHLATLYHDDVMDEASLRRGQASANARFDNRVAILAGDWLFAKASAIAAELGTYVSRVLAETIGVVCEGQIMESEHTGRPDQTAERYLETIKRKTAALLAASTHLGAWIAGCDEQTVAAATAYGEALGMAFQLSDDVLDITGQEEESGKVPGTDLREGVWTLPVLETLRGKARGGEKLRHFLQSSDVAGALELLRSNGSADLALDAAAGWGARASESIAGLPGGPAKSALEQLAAFVSRRSA